MLFDKNDQIDDEIETTQIEIDEEEDKIPSLQNQLIEKWSQLELEQIQFAQDGFTLISLKDKLRHLKQAYLS